MNNLSYANCKNMAEYRSKYYASKANIKEQSITIENTLKIRMLNNLGPAFKTYLTVVNNRIQKDKKLEENKALFKVIEEKETRIVIEQKVSVNFVMIKSHYLQLQERGKENLTEWPLYKKCACKHLLNRTCRHAEDECYRYHVKRHIPQFHNLYIMLNKGSDKKDKPTLVAKMPKANIIYLGVIC